MSEDVVEQAAEVEQTEKESPAPAVVDRKVAHWHQADKRASQQGPIQGSEPVVGRQKKEPCYETVYFVKNPGGLKVNERLYQNRVTVPECVANTLNDMDRSWEVVERGLFRNTPVSRDYHVQ